MKVNTVEQFKVLESIKANFEMEHIKVEIVDTTSLKVTDSKGFSLVFYYKDGVVTVD